MVFNVDSAVDDADDSSRWERIINVSSIAGITGIVARPTIGAKGALNAATKSLSQK